MLYKEVVVRSIIYFLTPTVWSLTQSQCDVTFTDLSSDPHLQVLTYPVVQPVQELPTVKLLLQMERSSSYLLHLSEEPVSTQYSTITM